MLPIAQILPLKCKLYTWELIIFQSLVLDIRLVFLFTHLNSFIPQYTLLSWNINRQTASLSYYLAIPSTLQSLQFSSHFSIINLSHLTLNSTFSINLFHLSLLPPFPHSFPLPPNSIPSLLFLQPLISYTPFTHLIPSHSIPFLFFHPILSLTPLPLPH